MFYVKEGDTTITIEDDNVFNTYPGCGVEYCVDLNAVLKGDDSDLYSTQVYFSECSRQIQSRRGLHLHVPSDVKGE